MLHVALSSKQAGTETFRLTPTADMLEMDPTEWSNIEVDLQLDYQVRQIVVSSRVRATAHLICDRTLVPFDLPIEDEYTLLLTSEDVNPSDVDEVRRINPSDPFIDLADVVRDTLILALPLKRIAPDAPPLEPSLQFGRPANTDQEIDPRWEALRKFQTDTPDL